MAFVVMIHAGDHADAQRAGFAGDGGDGGGEGFGGERVADHYEFFFANAFFGEAVGGGLRVADDGVAPAEGGRLRVKLAGGEEVSELALAADYDGNAGETRDGDQGEVGVEVEGVGDLDVLLAQVAAETPAGAEGFCAVEAAAEPEFGDVSEIFGEGADAADTAEAHVKLGARKILGEDGELALGASGLE